MPSKCFFFALLHLGRDDVPFGEDEDDEEVDGEMRDEEGVSGCPPYCGRSEAPFFWVFLFLYLQGMAGVPDGRAEPQGDNYEDEEMRDEDGVSGCSHQSI